MEIFCMTENRLQLTIHSKSMAMDEYSDIGINNDLHYSSGRFAKLIFWSMAKFILDFVDISINIRTQFTEQVV